MELNVGSRFFIYALVFVKLTLKQSKYIEIRIFGIKIFLNLNILRTVNDKPNLKKDFNSELKNKLGKVTLKIYCYKIDPKIGKNNRI